MRERVEWVSHLLWNLLLLELEHPYGRAAKMVWLWCAPNLYCYLKQNICPLFYSLLIPVIK
jgi:hypothetical protein